MDPVLNRVCPVSFTLISFDFSRFILVSYSRSEFRSNQECQIALEEPNHKCVQRCIEKSVPGLRHRLESTYEHIDEKRVSSMCQKKKKKSNVCL